MTDSESPYRISDEQFRRDVSVADARQETVGTATEAASHNGDQEATARWNSGGSVAPGDSVSDADGDG